MIHGAGADERIIAVGQYYALEDRPDVAEVSFLVEDAMQRRGIGTLLLDLLAEIAREHGVNRFSADVLADNHVMLSVFRKAGYALSSAVSYGVTHLEFPIAYSDDRGVTRRGAGGRSRASVVAPGARAAVHRGNRRQPRSAIGRRRVVPQSDQVGIRRRRLSRQPASERSGGRACLRFRRRSARSSRSWFSSPCPRQAVLDAARQCASLGVRALCVISAGFAETGAEGAAAQAELLDLCRAHGMRLVGPNCLGLVNTSSDVRMLGAFTPMDPPAGNIAISSQSGALGIALINRARQLGLGISSFASVGNKARRFRQ